MDAGVMDAPVPPRPEDFGLSEHSLDSVPRPRIEARRGLCVVIVYGSAVALVLSAALALSGSVNEKNVSGNAWFFSGSSSLPPARCF